MSNTGLALITFTLAGCTVFAASPVLPSKTAQPLNAGQRFAAAAQSAAHGKFARGGKGPSHSISSSSANNSTLAHWNGTFTSGGKQYPFQMVGTDPSKGSATTYVDTAIIPYKLIFSDGSVIDATKDLIDGRTALQGAIESPVFQNSNWKAGSVNLGNTQFADAVQRANFWNSVSTHSPNYHVLLSGPRVLKTQVIHVPADEGLVTVDSSTNRNFGVVDIQWLDNTLVSVMEQLGIQPTTLAIHQFGEMFAVGLNGEGALGYHDAVDFTGSTFTIQGAVTYIFSDWFSNAAFGNEAGIGNTGTLGHEINEWVNDPFVGNIVPYWQDPATPGSCEQDYLEVADPLEDLNYFNDTTFGFSYALPDVVFLPWFERISPSTSVNGWYTFRNQLPSYSKACPGFVDYNFSSIDYPGAVSTALTSINNSQESAGYWLDASNNSHSFILNGTHFTSVNVPGATSVQANKINDQGEVVGFYVDGGGHQHGFTWLAGHSATVDYPGGKSTSITGLNNAGTLVGMYLDGGGATHSFELTGFHFQPVTAPFAVDISVNAINNFGQLAGAFDDGNPADLGAFVGTAPHFTQLAFPASTQNAAFSLNNSAQVVGVFNDGFAIHGLIEIGGLYGEFDGGLDFDGALVTYIFDNNDGGTLVGYFQDANGVHGYIAPPVN